MAAPRFSIRISLPLVEKTAHSNGFPLPAFVIPYCTRVWGLKGFGCAGERYTSSRFVSRGSNDWMRLPLPNSSAPISSVPVRGALSQATVTSGSDIPRLTGLHVSDLICRSPFALSTNQRDNNALCDLVTIRLFNVSGGVAFRLAMLP